MSVQRWKWDTPDDPMVKSHTGAFVTYANYGRLQDQAAEAEYQAQTQKKILIGEIQKNAEAKQTIEKLERLINDLYPLAICHAAVYKLNQGIKEIHPVHAELLARAKPIAERQEQGRTKP